MAAFNFPDPALQQVVENPITGSIYEWKEPPGKWVLMTQSGGGVQADLIWEGPTPPVGGDHKLWYHTEELELYFNYTDINGNSAWIPTAKPITLLDDLDTAVSELRTDLYQVNIATAENENRIGRTVEFSDTAPTIHPDDIFDGVSYPSELNFKFWYDTARLELLILFRDADGDDSYVPVSIPLEALPDPGVSTEVFTYTTGRLQTAIEENYLHNLSQDTSIDGLKNDIVELEEEIDAIAPSVERGKWRFTAVGTVANPGQFTMYDAEFGSGNPTGLFKSAKSIWFNEVDTDGVTHAFGDVDDGELLEIFVEGAPEYGLYEVVGQAHDETVGATSFWVIDVNFVRTIEDTAAVAPNEICRFKVFMAPTGGDASSFVLKTGDTMTGQLEFSSEQADDSHDYNKPAANTRDIRFSTTRLDTGYENSTSLYKPGFSNALVCSGALMSRASLYTTSYLYGTTFKDDGTRVTYAPRIYFARQVDSNDNVTNQFGALRWNGTNILSWKDTEITIDKPINITNNALATDDQHAIHRGYVDKVGRMSGLQLGKYTYKRSGDSFSAGAIKSNTTTNPTNITEISLYKNNYDGITFGASFLLNLIVPKMYLHFMDKDSASYVGRIDSITSISNGIKMSLTPMTSQISGSVYLNNKYDVSISYNQFGVNKFPQ